MKQRFTYLYRDKSTVSLGSCPLVLTETALLHDLERGRSLGQLTFRAESAEPIHTVTATLVYKDAAGNALGSTVYAYTDLSCTQGEHFGADHPILIPDTAARSITPVHIAVQLSSGAVFSGAPDGKAAAAVKKEQSHAAAVPQVDAVEKARQAREAAERRQRLAQEAAVRKEQQAQEAAERRERLAKEAAAKKELLKQEAAVKREQMAQQAAVRAEVNKVKTYAKAKATLEQAKSAKDVNKAKSMFMSLLDFQDADRQLICCNEKLKALAMQMLEQPKSPKDLKAAEEIFRSLGDNEELSALIEQCHTQYEELSAKKGGKTKKLVKGIVIAAAVIALAVAAVPVSKTYIIPAVKYTQADKLAQSGSYDEAIAIFAELGEYKDAQHRTWQTTYAKGVYLLEHCDYPAASSVFASLHDFEDARERVKEAEYLYGEELMIEKKYPEAVGALLAAEDFADAPQLIDECYLLWAEEEYHAGNYETVVELVKSISDRQILSPTPETDHDPSWEEQMEMMAEAGITEFPEQPASSETVESSGLPEFYMNSAYHVALQRIEANELPEAVALFEEILDFGDSRELRLETMYAHVAQHVNNPDEYTYAYLPELTEANYADSKKLAETIYAWTVEIAANNSLNSKEGQDTITGTMTCYFHITLKGGQPEESIPVYARVRYPGGTSDKFELGEMKKDGYNYVYFNAWGNYPTGNCTITVYNGTTNREIGKLTVNLS